MNGTDLYILGAHNDFLMGSTCFKLNKDTGVVTQKPGMPNMVTNFATINVDHRLFRIGGSQPIQPGMNVPLVGYVPGGPGNPRPGMMRPGMPPGNPF